jgi:proteasome lid subunit RPN8/RPN11
VDPELVTIASFDHRGDAEITCAHLVAGGIPALVQADNEGGLNPGFFSEYHVRVVVRKQDEAAARDLLASDDRGFPGEMVAAMVAHARFAAPEEACGLLAADPSGQWRMVYCLTNRESSPYRFTVDPNEHYRAMRHAERNGWEIAGVFHSHPKSAATPSATDVAGALDPDWLYVIVSLQRPDVPEVRSFRIRDGVVEAVGPV